MSASRDILFPRDESDKINQLPDDILLKFISLLDLRNAVKTSVLAKRWRYLWTLLIDLDLDPRNMSPDNTKRSTSNKIGAEGFLRWVNQITEAHRSPCVKKFRVCSYSKWTLGHVEQWARFAFSKRVEELDLDLIGFYEDPSFSMSLDLLKQFPINGIFNLKSLRLSSIDIGGEALEYILLHSPMLERLSVDDSHSLRTLHLFSNKLKHFSLIACRSLEELEIDAVNLISFYFIECAAQSTSTLIVFKRVPKLVDVHFKGEGFFHPFLALELISSISQQLTKLSLFPLVIPFQLFTLQIDSFEVQANYFDSFKRALLSPNVKHLTVSVDTLNPPGIIFTKFLVDVCPKLHGLKLQVGSVNKKLRKEAKVLQEIELEDGEKEDELEDKFFICIASLDDSVSYNSNPNYYYKNQCHFNLKVLEIVGFRGGNADVEFAMDIIACADSVETLICDRQDFREFGEDLKYYKWDEDVSYKKAIRIRARKLAKLLPPRIKVGVRDAYSLFRVS